MAGESCPSPRKSRCMWFSKSEPAVKKRSQKSCDLYPRNQAAAHVLKAIFCKNRAVFCECGSSAFAPPLLYAQFVSSLFQSACRANCAAIDLDCAAVDRDSAAAHNSLTDFRNIPDSENRIFQSEKLFLTSFNCAPFFNDCFSC